MLADATYIGPVLAAETLRLAGAWDAALDVLSGCESAAGRRARAEVLADRFWWQHRGEAAAEAAVVALAADDPVAAGLLGGELAYTRLFGLSRPLPDDLDRAQAGFVAAAGGWGLFWAGVLADNVLSEPALAAERYAAALERAGDDDVLRSYVVRHQGFALLDTDLPRARAMLRESLDLRIAAGALPAVAGAAATLAELGDAGWLPVARALTERLDLASLRPHLPGAA